ncbi:uncharacterized protein RJT20DRAFT_136142 [Scheffersomyces xylosifermentans]|uniref:uncharacterized protein n=1 Tax=Scheffersomyces xylosifermentans TaxID=1304137 RepID=UPI00315CF5DD
MSISSFRTSKSLFGRVPTQVFRGFSVSGARHNIENHIELAAKPQFTGGGPFVELPSFTPIGSPSKLLNISLPQSSKLSIRSGSMVAINGDLQKVKSSTRFLTSTTDYQELESATPVSLVINGNNGNYSIIEIHNPNEEWVVLNHDNIIAWTGFGFKLEPISLFQKLSSFKTSGKGVLVVNGDNELFAIEVPSNEEILVSPQSLIATTVKPNVQILKRDNKYLTPIESTPILRSLRFPRITFPRHGVLGSITMSIESFTRSLRANILKGLETSGMRSGYASLKQFLAPVGHYLHVFYDKSKLFLIDRAIKTSPIYFKITGPARLLVNSVGESHTGNRRTFTKREIEAIFNRRQ